MRCRLNSLRQAGGWSTGRWLVVMICLWLTGEIARAGEKPNVFQTTDAIFFKRVTLLPMTFPSGYGDEAWSREKCEPLLREKLIQTGRFEVVTVSPDQLRRWTGKNAWLSTERLPVDLLGRVQAETGCEAVMFVHLNGLSAYPPLSVSWRMRLVRVVDGQTVWAVEDSFAVKTSKLEQPLKDVWFLQQKERADWSRMNSPESLIRKSLESIFCSLPQGGIISAKVSPAAADTSRRVGANQRKPRLPAKETKYGNQTEPTSGAAHAAYQPGSGQDLPEAGD